MFRAIYSSHVLEHLFPHEAPKALSEFLRVLETNGSAVIFVPDLEDVRATEDVLFNCIAGPITGLDLIYGHRRELVDRPHMAHRNGFTAKTLGKLMEDVGFREVRTKRMFDYNLLAVGRK